jgi:hypothetical protein
MAIKLEVQDALGGRASIPAAGQIPTADAVFGRVGLQSVNLPQENIAGNMSAMMRTGQAAGSMFNQLGQAAMQTSSMLEGMARAEDDTTVQKTLLELKQKRSEIQQKNMMAAAEGKITYAQLADINKQEIEDVNRTTLETIKLNVPSTRDNLQVKLLSEVQDQYNNDVSTSIQQIAKEKKQGFLNNIDGIIDGIGSIEDFKKAQAGMIDLYSSPMASVIGTETLKKYVLDKSTTKINSVLTNDIKTNPELFLQNLAEGNYGPMLVHKSEDEIAILQKSAQQQIVANQNAAFEAQNKQSDKIRDRLALQLDTGQLYTEAEIMAIPGLTDQHRSQLINKSNDLTGNTVEKRRRINETQQQIELANGSLRLVTPERQEEYITAFYPELYNNGFKSQEGAVKSSSQIKQLGGVPPKGMIDFALQAPTQEATIDQQKVWANNVINVVENIAPEQITKSEKKSEYDIALRIQNMGETYQVAKANLTEPDRVKELAKNFDASVWKQKSAYKEPATAIADQLGMPVDQVPVQWQEKLKILIQEESVKRGGSQEQITKRAISTLNIGKIKLPNGEEQYMSNAPVLIPEYEQYFVEDVDTTAKKYNLTNPKLQSTGQQINGHNTYYVTDPDGQPKYDPETGQLIFVTVDEEKYRLRLINEKLYKESIPTNIIGMKQEASTLATLQKNYPETLAQFPGVLNAMYTAESSRGKNLVSPKGAQGPFQFMPDTAKQYGVKNPFDFTQASEGAAKMMNELLGKYNNNLAYALAAYNWGSGNVDKWIKNGADFNDLPNETQKYVKSITGSIS